MFWLTIFWHQLLTVSAIAAGSTTTGEKEGSISLSLTLDGQYGDEGGTPSTHRVFVGASGALRFRPQHVEAAVGDIITFEFLALNHSVKQSSFDSPCASGGGVFDTEFWQYNPSDEPRHTVDLLVTTTTPQWFYCQQTIPWPHCSAGMVFAVNPGAHWEEFLARAQHRSPAGSTGIDGPGTEPCHPLNEGSSTRIGTGSTTFASYTYDPRHPSSMCDTATSSATGSFTSPGIVIVPLDTASPALERRTMLVGGSGSGYVHGDELSLWGTAHHSWLGKTQPFGPLTTAALSLGTAPSRGAISGTASSYATGICGGNPSTTSTWQWPSRTSALPSVQSATALSAASYNRSVGMVVLASIVTILVSVLAHLVILG